MSGPLTFARFLAFDQELARHGFLACSDWWLEQAERYLDHPTAREWYARVGRGGAKSTMLVKLAGAEVALGHWVVPPGERHYFALVSVSRDEASQRLTLLSAYLKALGVGHGRANDTIDLVDSPLGVKVLACQVQAVSGFRCIGFAGDELAKWRSADDGANPAKEIAASLRAMTVTHKQARAAFFSSPLSSLDWHSSRIDLGETRRQIVSQAPTWIANPSITEAETHELEPDDRLWRREYLAIPQAGALSAFDEDDVERAFKPRGDLLTHSRRALVLDASSGKKDRFTFGICGWSTTVGGDRVLTFDMVDGFDAKVLRDIGGDAAVLKIATIAKEAGATMVYADQRESMMLRAAFRRCGMVFFELPWTAPSKARGVARVRRWLLEGRVALPAHDRLRRELLSFEERVTTSGDFTFGARGSGHDDFVSLLITAALADEDRRLPGSPLTASSDEPRHRAPQVSPYEMRDVHGTPSALDQLELVNGATLVIRTARRARQSYTFARRSPFGGGF